MIAPSQKKARRPDGSWYNNPVWEKFIEATAEEVGERVEWKWFNVEITVTRKTRSMRLACRLKTTLDALTRAKFWNDDRGVAKIVIKYGSWKKEQTVVKVTEAAKKW